MEENIKIIETPFKKFKVEIKTYLTAEDELEIQKVFYDVAEVSVGSSGAQAKISGKKGDAIINEEKKLMEKAVVKINGEARDILKRLMEMPAHDYNFIRKEVDKIRDYEAEKKN